MRFVKLTLQYCKRNFFLLLLGAAVPAMLFVVFARPFGVLVFFYDYFSGALDMSEASFVQVFQYFSVINFEMSLLWIAAFFAAVFFAGTLFCLVERDMKYGKIKGTRLRDILQTCVLVIIPMVLAFAVVLTLTGLITAGVIFWTGRALPRILVQIGCIALVPFVYLTVFSFLTPLTCWISCTTNDGINFLESVGLSVRLCSKDSKQLLLTAYITVSVLQVASFAGSFNDLAFKIVMFAVTVLMCMFAPVYINTVYFEVAEMPRMDGRRMK